MTAMVKIDDCEFLPARLSTDDVVAMTREGVLPEGRGYELIEGVLVRMAAQLDPHVRMVADLMRAFITAVPPDYVVSPAPSIFLSDDTMLEPDICIYPATMRSQDVRGQDIALAIEVTNPRSSSSGLTRGSFSAAEDPRIKSEGDGLIRDLGKKARLYAAHGVAHYWVIDLAGEKLHRHEGADGEGYTDVTAMPLGNPVRLPFGESAEIVLR